MSSDAEVSGWAPFRRRMFTALWLAQLGSNIGTWMQTVGAQWMLVDVSHAATLVALVQTASMAPMLLLALPAGVLADVLDRRWLLLITQAAMASVAAVIAILTAANVMTPALLLTMTFLLGCGAALMAPAWQAIQPELVPRDQIPAAAALGGMNVNLARAIGPALAGVLVAGLGPAAVFGINALSFLAVLAVLALWHRPEESRADPERVVPALFAGLRYVRHAPGVRRILVRAALFVVPASALWALLPIVARDSLGLGSIGYGGLLAALGIGAVVGAAIMPRMRGHLSANAQLAISALTFAAATAALARTTNLILVSVLLVLAGVAWLTVLSILNAALKLTVAAWVRARALAVYVLVFIGGQGVASLVWGLLAAAVPVSGTLLIAAALLAVCAASVRLLPLHPETGTLDRTPRPPGRSRQWCPIPIPPTGPCS
ncbi:MFS transporter [Rhodococcus sp. NPDC127528]|uniref:MFS transporter n=1 Tax=unclassified Rhodococcus (in: high G+C Gram-positive bacteria) TaxID=192944 RepID=UPI00363B3F01